MRTTRLVPIFRLPPGSALAASVGPQWTILPLRIPTGWGIRWNTLIGRTLKSGEVEVNDSEDLFWAVKLPPSDSGVYEADPESRWREIHVDVGWYRDLFRIVMLDPDWEHVRHSYTTTDVEQLVHTLEDWLVQIASDGDLQPQSSDPVL